MKTKQEESIPELIGGIIGCLVVMAFYLAVPVFFIIVGLKILGVF